jgi:putative ABC transport system permease protein
MGMARVEHGRRARSVFVYGVNSAVPDVWKFVVRQGRFLPEGDLSRAAALVVLGPKLKRELFGDDNALGSYVRVGGRRFMVVGVMAPKGLLLGLDIDDVAYVPVAAAQQLFNRDDLMEIDAMFAEHLDPDAVVADVRAVLRARHDGEEDFSVTTCSGS